jgi:hypothetical protein
MEAVPFKYKAERPARKLSFDKAGLQIHEDFMFPVNRMEVRGCVIAIKHLDDDPKKPADLRHRTPSRLEHHLRL